MEEQTRFGKMYLLSLDWYSKPRRNITEAQVLKDQSQLQFLDDFRRDNYLLCWLACYLAKIPGKVIRMLY